MRLAGKLNPYGFVWVVLGLLHGLTACSDPFATPLALAHQAFYQGQYVQAEACYRKLWHQGHSRGAAALRVPQEVEILRRLGQLNMLYLDKPIQALNDYSMLVQQFPQSQACDEAWRAIGTLQQDALKHPDEALKAFERWLGLYPQHPLRAEVLMRMIQADLAQNQTQQARQRAQLVLQDFANTPQSVQASFVLAQTDARQTQLSKTITSYQELLDHNHDTALEGLIAFELGNCYVRQGENTLALQAYYRALQTHPNPLLVQHKIARVRSRMYHMAPRANILNVSIPARMWAAQLRPNLLTPTRGRRHRKN